MGIAEILWVVIPYYMGVALGIGFMYWVEKPTKEQFRKETINTVIIMTILLIIFWLFT